MFILKQNIGNKEIVLSEYENEDVARKTLLEARRQFQEAMLSVEYAKAKSTNISWQQWVAITVLSISLVGLRHLFMEWSTQSAIIAGLANFAIITIFIQMRNYDAKLKIHNITDVEKLRIRGKNGNPIIEPIPEVKYGRLLVYSLKQEINGNVITLSEYFEKEDAQKMLLSARRQHLSAQLFIEREYMIDPKHEIAFWGPLITCPIIGALAGFFINGIMAGIVGGMISGVLISMITSHSVQRQMPSRIHDVESLKIQDK